MRLASLRVFNIFLVGFKGKAPSKEENTMKSCDFHFQKHLFPAIELLFGLLRGEVALFGGRFRGVLGGTKWQYTIKNMFLLGFAPRNSM